MLGFIADIIGIIAGLLGIYLFAREVYNRDDGKQDNKDDKGKR